MPDSCRDRPRPLRAASPWEGHLTAEEEERLEALAAPWPERWLRYLVWLTDTMPGGTGCVLMMALIGVGVSLIVGSGIGVMFLITHGLWLFCLLGGMALGLIGRAVVQDAAATELRYRRAIADKQQKQKQKERTE